MDENSALRAEIEHEAVVDGTRSLHHVRVDAVEHEHIMIALDIDDLVEAVASREHIGIVSGAADHGVVSPVSA
ncbi:MAG: hypothetical protein LBL48_05545 [Azoarcus sp.]|nr:hypothetical protein [Azoarcus sp.]